MNKLKIITDPAVAAVYEKYPAPVRKKILTLRKLIVEAATEIEHLDELQECLRWGEPSFIAKKGSTIRIDWKPKTPDQYAIYFKCTSSLVPTFKLLYNEIFNYEGTRAIIFQMKEKVPKAEIKNCIRAALQYHSVKKLPTLGI